MADASQQFLIDVPANGSPSNIFIYNMPLGPSDVQRILITWPPGVSGLVPVQIMAGEQAAFPRLPGTFFVFDNYTYSFDVSNQINSGQWSMATYNLDTQVHNIQVVFEFNFLRGQQASDGSLPISL